MQKTIAVLAIGLGDAARNSFSRANPEIELVEVVDLLPALSLLENRRFRLIVVDEAFLELRPAALDALRTVSPHTPKALLAHGVLDPSGASTADDPKFSAIFLHRSQDEIRQQTHRLLHPRRFRRRNLKGSGLFVVAQLPGRQLRHPLVNLSNGGLCFELQPGDRVDGLLPGQTLREVRIEGTQGETLFRCSRASVRYCERYQATTTPVHASPSPISSAQNSAPGQPHAQTTSRSQRPADGQTSLRQAAPAMQECQEKQSEAIFVGVRFEEEVPVLAARGHVLRDPLPLAALLRKVSTGGNEFFASLPNQNQRWTLGPATLTSKGALSFTHAPKGFELHEVVEISFEHHGLSYLGLCSVLNNSDGLILSSPRSLEAIHRRGSHRHRPLPGRSYRVRFSSFLDRRSPHEFNGARALELAGLPQNSAAADSLDAPRLGFHESGDSDPTFGSSTSPSHFQETPRSNENPPNAVNSGLAGWTGSHSAGSQGKSALSEHLSAGSELHSSRAEHLPAGAEFLSSGSEPLSPGSEHRPAGSEHLSPGSEYLSAGSEHRSAGSKYLFPESKHLSAGSEPLFPGSEHLHAASAPSSEEVKGEASLAAPYSSLQEGSSFNKGQMEGLRTAAAASARKEDEKHLRSPVSRLRNELPEEVFGESFEVYDVNASGLCAVVSSDRVLPPGLLLEGLEVELPSGERIYCQGEVRSLRPAPLQPWDNPFSEGSGEADDDSENPGNARQQKYHCGVVLLGLDDDKKRLLGQGLVGDVFTQLEVAQPGQSKDIWVFLKEAGFTFHVYNDWSPESERIVSETQEKVLGPARNIGLNILYRASDNHRGHIAGMRMYSRTWLSTHLAAKQGDTIAATGRVSRAICLSMAEHIESHDHADHVKFVWIMANKWTNRMFSWSGRAIHRPGLSWLNQFGVFVRPTSLPAPSPAPGFEVRDANFDELQELTVLLGRSEDPVRLQSEDLKPELIHLPELQREYAKGGLHRARRVRAVFHSGELLAYSLVEESTQALQLAELLNAFELVDRLPKDPRINGARQALISDAISLTRQRGLSHTVATAPEHLTPLFEEAGFTLSGVGRSWTFHKSQLRPWADVWDQLFLRGSELFSMGIEQR